MTDEDVLVAATTVVPDGEAFEDDAEWVEAVAAQEVRTIGAGSEVVQHDTTAEVSRAGTPVGARVGVGDDGCAPTSAVEGGTHLQLSSRSGTGAPRAASEKADVARFAGDPCASGARLEAVNAVFCAFERLASVSPR